MQYVFLDIEAVGKATPNDFQEIIEIAAYKVDEVDLSLDSQPELLKQIIFRNKQYYPTQEFHSYIKPVFHSLSKSIGKLTNIKQEDLQSADYFYEVIEAFKEWVGEEDVMFFAWSMNDKKMLEDNAREHAVFLSWLTSRYVDLQEEYDTLFMNRKNTSLTNALKNHGICNFRGVQHNALDDSYNTFVLFNDLTKNLNRYEVNKRG